MLLLVEAPGDAFGKLEGLGIDSHEEISSAARDGLARPTEAQASERLRLHAFVADLSAVTSASDNLRCAHEEPV